MKKIFRRLLIPLFFGALLAGSFVVHPALAQTDAATGLAGIAQTTGLGTEDPRIIVLKFVRVALGALGTIALVLFLYAGFVWMTAGGDDERVARAKRIMMNAVVGIVIILFSFAIVSFIIGAILKATGAGGSGGSGADGGAWGPGFGGGSGREFVVTGIAPQGQIPVRNAVLQITFSNLLDEATLPGAVVVTPKAGGAALQGTIAVRNNRITWTPVATCPEPNQARFCFDANTAYTVTVQTTVKNTDGKQLSCSNNRCTASFTSGDVIDTEAPKAELTTPVEGENVPSESSVLNQLAGTDDAGVAAASFAAGGVEFDAVTVDSATPLKEALLESLWYTNGLTLGERYRLTGTIFDFAGNTNDDSVTVRVRGPWCFNGVQDASYGETGIDCGGDAAKPEYCGACPGSPCTDTSACSVGGLCVSGTCVETPRIDKISPGSGAVGTFVTIKGVGFGAGGNVFFKGASGDIPATIPACVAPWTSVSVTVAVPAGAVTGPVKVVTSAGTSDATSDTHGPKIADFIVNDVKHPNLCIVDPTSATAGSSFTVTGENFGANRDTSEILFGNKAVASSYTSWSDTKALATVPRAGVGSYGLSVKVGGVQSNEVQFRILETATVNPVVTNITPDKGPVSTYVTIKGTGFGEAIGKVWFKEKQSGEVALGSDSFPAICKDIDNWTATQLLMKVPEKFQNTAKSALRVGDYTVWVESREGAKSNEVNFTVTAGQPGPSVCGLTPLAGDVGSKLTFLGEHFGTTKGAAIFTNNRPAVSINSWADGKVEAVVPLGAVSGDVFLKSSTDIESNHKSFTVGAAPANSTAPKTAMYHWWFSTGDVPKVPALITECSDKHVSAVPNNKFTPAVCVNAAVFAEFTEKMLPGTLNGAVFVEECTGVRTNICGSTKPVDGSLQAREESFTFSPAAAFKKDTTYRVRVTTAAQSARGIGLAKDIEWTFVTAATDTSCAVQKVMVAPPAATLRAKDATQDFAANAVNGCVVLDDKNIDWSWAVPQTIAAPVATTDTACTGPKCQRVKAVAEGTGDVVASASVAGASGVAASGLGVLTIKYTDPFVTDAWPNCTSACRNAVVGGTFNTAMNKASVEQGIKIFKCDNELCAGIHELSGVSVRCVENDTHACVGYSVDSLDLDPLGFYRVLVSATVRSESGVFLTKLNYANPRGYSYSFRVREGDVYCAIDRVSTTPGSAIAHAVGDRQSFVTEAYGLPDSCSVSGQRLNPMSYNWTWSATDGDRDNDPTTKVASLLNGGQYDVLGVSLPRGCTGSCLAAGSSRAQPICGNGVIERLPGGGGEECDDGNALAGDGCSLSCVREGALQSPRDVDGNGSLDICGDGVVNRSATSGAGEDCDPGKDASGKVVATNGCSATCLAEGSSSVGATCGNSDVATSSNGGGEECDDGNLQSGDGCTSLCLREGSSTLDQLGNALCGNGKVERPAEECEDTGPNDGCSDRCLLEGSSSSYAAPSSCGDGLVGTGEACDDDNKLNGDGCSDRCLLEGSSYRYGTASICGDGVQGLGEVRECEVGANGAALTSRDGRYDPVQIAEITNTAPREVDPATGKAIATISSLESVGKRSGSSSYTLLCSAKSDLDCAVKKSDGSLDESTMGRGTGNCCYERPTATLFPNAANTCLNAAIGADFTVPMDMKSFDDSIAVGRPKNFNLQLVLAAGQACPAGYDNGVARTALLERWYARMFSYIGGETANADSITPCFLKVGAYDVASTPSGGQRVVLHLPKMLEKNSTYKLTAVGDEALLGSDKVGLKSTDGVAMYDTKSVTFTTGSTVCTLDAVKVEDTDIFSPNTFTTKTVAGSEHAYVSSALSSSTGKVTPIVPVTGVYAWSWAWAADDKGEFFALDKSTAATPDRELVSAIGKSGEANIVATAVVTDDTLNIASASAKHDGVSGTSPAIAFICQNPWPSSADQGGFPWTDPDYNVGVYYCRDAGKEGFADDLPALTDIQIAKPETPGVLREYIFKAANSSGDAIGLRVFQNPKYLSPEAWYKAQNFTGQAKETKVRNFAAVSGGRSTYIAVPNFNEMAAGGRNGDIYSNIAVLSYSDNANSDMQQVYSQFATNLDFATNIKSVKACYQGAGVVMNGKAVKTCVSDNDCNVSGGEVCGDDRSKLARDTDRLGDITDIVSSVQSYGQGNGACSATTSRTCSTAAECPAGESCLAVVPTLPAGSFVRSMATSAWPSWKDAFGGALESTPPVDPLNAYAACGTKGTFEKYGNASCVDSTTNAYVCPNGSHVYTYRAIGNRTAELRTDLEYQRGQWVNPIEFSTDRVTVAIGHGGAPAAAGFGPVYCTDSLRVSAASVCGDGVLGSGEVCEVGQRGGAAIACGAGGNRYGVCNATCTAFVDDPTAACVAPMCGDGVKNGTEECDDGVNNGKYGFCGDGCLLATRSFCGDGKISGSEACDCGAAGSYVAPTGSDDRRSVGGLGMCVGSDGLSNFNGDYDTNKLRTCSFDCSGPANFCGDLKIENTNTDGNAAHNTPEQCDGGTQTWAGLLCTGGSLDGQPCADQASCKPGDANCVHSKTECSQAGGSCGSALSDQACSADQTRSRTCSDATATNACQYGATLRAAGCAKYGQCGNGVTEPGEQCDDGNGISTDGCTSSCKLNVCGDGFVDPAGEQCDLGNANGKACNANYGSSCTMCTVQCKNSFTSGPYCGDKIKNGGEYCDGSFSADTYPRYKQLTASPFTFKDPCTSTTDPLCVAVGVCDGGPTNGAYCRQGVASDCGAGGTCMMPSCSQSCQAACPVTFESKSLSMTGNTPGSRPVSELYVNKKTDSAYPNVATLNVPACLAAKSVIADVDLSQVDLPDVYVVFVTDRSDSMKTGGRLDSAKAALKDSIEQLYNKLGDRVHIALVGFHNAAGTGICSSTWLSACNAAADCSSDPTKYTCDDRLDNFYDFSSESTLTNRVQMYTPNGGTRIDLGLDAARDLFVRKMPSPSENSNVRRVVILMTDGAPTGSTTVSGKTLTSTSATSLKLTSEIYTIGLGVTASDLINLNSWSSNNGAAKAASGIDYSADNATTQSLGDIYSSIVRSITSFSFSITDKVGQTAQSISTTTDKTSDIVIPLPSTFKCAPTPQEVPVQFTFSGIGKIGFKNVRLDYCPIN